MCSWCTHSAHPTSPSYVGPHGLTPGRSTDLLVLSSRGRPLCAVAVRLPLWWEGGSASFQPRCGGLQYAARHISGPVHLGGLGGATLARQVPRRGVTHILVCFPFLVKAYYIQNGIPYTVIIGSALLFILVAVSVSALRGHPVWDGGGARLRTRRARPHVPQVPQVSSARRTCSPTVLAFVCPPRVRPLVACLNGRRSR